MACDDRRLFPPPADPHADALRVGDTGRSYATIEWAAAVALLRAAPPLDRPERLPGRLERLRVRT